MIKNASLKLLLLNAAVFILVLSCFAGSVYYSIDRTINHEAHAKLESIVNALISSIEPPEADEPIPDVVQTYDTSKQDELFLEWYDSKFKLVAEKGVSKPTLEFNAKEGMLEQASPHALTFTRSVYRNHSLFGYLRTSMLLADFDQLKNRLLIGLLFSIALSIFFGSIAIVFLVKQSLQPIEESMRRLTEFTDDAAHELKSPVAAIKTNSEVALHFANGMREGDRQKFLAMDSAANQMTATIDALLALAIAERPNQSTGGTASLAIAVQEILRDFKPLAEEREAKILTNLEESPIELQIKQPDLQIVLSNLCRNALIYSNPEGTVEITAKTSADTVEISVADKGIGIAKDEISRVFDRFWRSDKVRSYRSGGSGLGLSLVKTIVENYGGEVSITSALGEGTTVSVKLRLAH